MSAILRERYRLEHRLGSGGAADVHRATDTVLDRPVAVKVLRDVGTDPSSRERFTSEARTLASLSHRNLVTVLDAGIDDGVDRPFLVMELVEGRSLSDAMRAGPLPPEEVARVGSQVAAALAFAHERGVVHRDVKPGNVLLSDAGAVKLADFGIAKILDSTTRHTRTGTAIGTAAYLSPEQVRGEPVTGAVDVYALGLVLLEALTGVRAFPGTPTESALARLQRDPDVPADLPTGWSVLLTAMTAADPTARPAADEVARTLSGPLEDHAPPTALLTAPVAATSVTGPGRTLDRAGDAIAASPGLLLARWRSLEAHQRGVAAALAAIVALLVVAAIAAGGASTPTPDEPLPASQTPTGTGQGSEDEGVEPVDQEPVVPLGPVEQGPPGQAKGKGGDKGGGKPPKPAKPGKAKG